MNYQDKLRYFAQICLAAAEGKQIQTRDALQGWRDIRMEDVRQYAPDSFGGNALRIKPDPTPEYWSRPEHVPGPVCYLRKKHNPKGWCMIIAVSDTHFGVHTSFKSGGEWSTGSISLPWSALEDCEYSTTRADNDWQPCTVKEAR